MAAFHRWLGTGFDTAEAREAATLNGTNGLADGDSDGARGVATEGGNMGCPLAAAKRAARAE